MMQLLQYGSNLIKIIIMNQKFLSSLLLVRGLMLHPHEEDIPQR